MIFWGLRFFVLLSGLIAGVANWRFALIVTYALAADFVTYLWMALPLFSVRNELMLLLGVCLVTGSVIAVGRKALSPPWVAATVCAGLLVVLRGSLYLVGYLTGTLQADDIGHTVPSAVILAMGSGSAMLLPAMILRRRREGPRR
jgi:hypothetical protein